MTVSEINDQERQRIRLKDVVRNKGFCLRNPFVAETPHTPGPRWRTTPSLRDIIGPPNTHSMPV